MVDWFFNGWLLKAISDNDTDASTPWPRRSTPNYHKSLRRANRGEMHDVIFQNKMSHVCSHFDRTNRSLWWISRIARPFSCFGKRPKKISRNDYFQKIVLPVWHILGKKHWSTLWRRRAFTAILHHVLHSGAGHNYTIRIRVWGEGVSLTNCLNNNSWWRIAALNDDAANNINGDQLLAPTLPQYWGTLGVQWLRPWYLSQSGAFVHCLCARGSACSRVCVCAFKADWKQISVPTFPSTKTRSAFFGSSSSPGLCFIPLSWIPQLLIRTLVLIMNSVFAALQITAANVKKRTKC